jgi:hypothetical protein
MTRRGIRMLALSLVVAMIVASCGGGSGDDSNRASDTSPTTAAALSPLAIVKQAVATTRASGTARSSLQLVSDITAFSANEYAEGLANLRSGDSEFTHDMSSTPNGLVPDGTPPSQVVLKAREVGNSLYLSLPPAFKAAGIDQTWVKVPADLSKGVSGFKGLEGMSPRIGLSARFERPAVAFDILDTASAARDVGTATVRGKPTTRYSIDVKLRTLLEAVGLMFFFGNPTTPEQLAAIDELCAKAAHVDVFIDELGRIRELFVDADLTIVAPHFTPPQDPRFWRELRIEWDFFDYGVPVNVEAPTQSVLDRTS